MKSKIKYHVEIEPSGAWVVSLLETNRVQHFRRFTEIIASGRVPEGASIMGRAEMAARDAITSHRNKRAEEERLAKGVKRFTLPY